MPVRLPRRGDVVVAVGLVSISYTAGALLDAGTYTTVSSWVVGAVVTLMVASLTWPVYGWLIPERLTMGGPTGRMVFHFGPLLVVNIVATMWVQTIHDRAAVSLAAGATAAAGLRLWRRWSAWRAMSKEEREASVEDPGHSSLIVHIVMTVVEVGVLSALATYALIWGDQLAAALDPVFLRAAEDLPGRHVTVAGHSIVAGAASLLFGLLFALVLTNGFLRALAAGLADWQVPRGAQYFWAGAPFVIGLGWSVRQPGLAFGCTTTLVLLVCLYIWTDAPPTMALSKLEAASALWRSRLRARLHLSSGVPADEQDGAEHERGTPVRTEDREPGIHRRVLLQPGVPRLGGDQLRELRRQEEKSQDGEQGGCGAADGRGEAERHQGDEAEVAHGSARGPQRRPVGRREVGQDRVSGEQRGDHAQQAERQDRGHEREDFGREEHQPLRSGGERRPDEPGLVFAGDGERRRGDERDLSQRHPGENEPDRIASDGHRADDRAQPDGRGRGDDR